MFSAFQTFGRLGAGGLPFSERALWPLGSASPGLWIDPSYPASCYQDSAGTTALSTVGTVLDSSNPIGLMLDRKAGATSKTDPGLHLSQSTSAARPVASGRVNLLTYSQTLNNAAWTKEVGGTGTTPVVTDAYTGAAAPDGTFTASRLQASISGTTSGDISGIQQGSGATVIARSSRVLIKSNTSSSQSVWFRAGGAERSITATTSWVEVFDSGTTDYFTLGLRGSISGAGTLDILVWHPSSNLGSVLRPYQRVGAASDYTATGFPAYLKFDGRDDGLPSATFAAGTLTSSMDCLIAVRRDSAADDKVHGLYDPSNMNKWFAACAAGSSARCVALQPVVGNPTVWVDGTQLTGGTDVTRGTLHTALTVGARHILELRGLDLSSWNQLGIGKYPGAESNSAFGKIFLFSSGQDANRDKARASMAAYYGVTLP